MANFKGHVIGGIAIFAATIFLFSLIDLPLSKLILGFIFTVSGALFPDIDIKSKGQQLFYGLLLFILLAIVYYKSYKVAVLVSIVSFLPFISAHRGIFHNFWFLLFLIVSVSLFLYNLFPGYQEYIFMNSGFFTLGVISHLFLDLGFKKIFKF